MVLQSMNLEQANSLHSERERTLKEISQKLKVCGHPVRLELLCAIAKEDNPCVSELWFCVKQPQPVVSQHLAVLKERGIVESKIKGNRRIYSISDPYVKRLVESLKEQFGELSRTATAAEQADEQAAEQADEPGDSDE